MKSRHQEISASDSGIFASRELPWHPALNHFFPLSAFILTLRGKNHPGGGGGLFRFLTVAPGFPTQCPLHMFGQMAWPLGGRLNCSRTWLCLTSSTRLSFGSSWGRSVIPISLISLMRAEGTGPHFVCCTEQIGLPRSLLDHFSIQK